MALKTKSWEKVKRGGLLFLVFTLVLGSIFLLSREDTNITGLSISNPLSESFNNSFNNSGLNEDFYEEIEVIQEDNLKDPKKSKSSKVTKGVGSKKPPTPAWVPKFNEFLEGENLDWKFVPDIENVCDGLAIIEIPNVGKIKWLGCVDASGADFNKFIEIRKGKIIVNSSMLDPSFNSSAELTMTGLEFKYAPAIYRDGELCSTCKIINYSQGNLIFNVQGFSSYTFGSNTKITIWDETDPETMPHAGKVRYPTNETFFFADYKNITSDQTITTATCFINFTDSNAVMTYNSTKNLYEYSRSFSNSGAYEYNISCSASGYESLSTIDLSSISAFLHSITSSGPRGANITEISSSKGSITSPESHNAIAGNVTEISVDGSSVTQSWQGYYGNISGAIELSNGAGDILYNWSSESPKGEVYASRSSGVNFGNISCAPTNHISNEENNLGQNSSDSDSISNTFLSSTHPEFFVGQEKIDENSCNSTNLYINSNPQSTSFFEVLISDNSANLVYVSLIEDDVAGFDNIPHDFEMIVGEDGHGGDLAVTPYYFYVELN